MKRQFDSHQIEMYWRKQIEGSHISLEDIPTLILLVGRMTPEDFEDMMEERFGNAEADAEQPVSPI